MATASKRRVDRLSSPAASETASIPRFASLGLCTSSECCPPNGSGSHSPDASARADRSSEPVHAASAQWRHMPCCAGRCDPIDYLSGCPRGTDHATSATPSCSLTCPRQDGDCAFAAAIGMSKIAETRRTMAAHHSEAGARASLCPSFCGGMDGPPSSSGLRPWRVLPDALTPLMRRGALRSLQSVHGCCGVVSTAVARCWKAWRPEP